MFLEFIPEFFVICLVLIFVSPGMILLLVPFVKWLRISSMITYVQISILCYSVLYILRNTVNYLNIIGIVPDVYVFSKAKTFCLLTDVVDRVPCPG